MANICFYKIKVRGTKQACYKLVDMMPLYSGEKEYISEEGTDDDFTLIFTGDCKWEVDAYTSFEKDLKPYTEEELDKVSDGDGWNYPLQNKSTLLNCEIFCNSKDIDDCCRAVYVHYLKGKEIFDDCPKELHIKRGRDYDSWYEPTSYCNDPVVEKEACKVRFDDNRSYWYIGKFEIGDLVYVEGAKDGCLGQVKDTSTTKNVTAIYNVINKIANIGLAKPEDIEYIWNSYKPKERKEYLKSINLPEDTTKKKYITLMENKWIEFAQKENNWDKFLITIK